MSQDAVITLSHGSGGKKTNQLVGELILARLGNPILAELDDGATLPALPGRPVLSTDSFVISPIFFPGGDIGKLCVAGTVNDLAVCGARPLYLSLGLILEEGFPLRQLEVVLDSLAAAARDAGVQVVTGDTKVVEKGHGDGLYINTTGLGALHPGFGAAGRPQAGDVVLVSGPLGDHGAAILAHRGGIELETALVSDCQAVHRPILDLLDRGVPVRFLRDPTRGGVAAVLNEIAGTFGVGVEVDEARLPVRPEVQGVCEILGLEATFLACEGRFIAIVPQEAAERALAVLKAHPESRDALAVGRITNDRPGWVVMNTRFGGRRVIDMPTGEQLPRIC
jgi:hydrogenase expression/formation protein HypE